MNSNTFFYEYRYFKLAYLNNRQHENEFFALYQFDTRLPTFKNRKFYST